MRPPFAYYGGKIGMARRIVQMLPDHQTYIEPFAGSLAVLFAKHPARCEIVNDRDDALVTFFRVLRDRPDELERVCALTPHARADYATADVDAEGLADLELARRFWIRVNQSFAKTAGSRTGWSITTARSQSVPGSIMGRLGRFGICAERLARVSIEHCDGAELIERLATADTAVYADPPYVHATRQRQGAGQGDDYRHEMSDGDHRLLAQALRATPAAVVLSGYPGTLYDELYDGWATIDVPVTTHSSNATSTTRGARVERIWTNRDVGAGRLPWDEGGAA